MLPKKSSQKPARSLRTGSLVLFDIEDTLRLGSVQGFARLKARVLSEVEKEHELTFSRLTILPEELPKNLHDDKEILRYLAEVRARAETLAKGIDIQKLWKNSKMGHEYTGEELCLLAFDKKTLDNYLALRFKLQAEPLYFKRRKQSFLPRTEEEIASFRKNLEEKSKKMALLSEGLANLELRVKDPQTPLSDKGKTLVELLLRVAAGASELSAQEKKDAKQIIDQFATQQKLSLGGSREERSHKVLQRVGGIHKNTNLSLWRHNFPITFDNECLSEAKRIADCSPPEAQREDLTSLHAVTIDDATTKDMDDALTIERISGGFRLGIHISNVAERITPGSIIDKAALKRATSLYLPELVSNMIPSELSQEKLSLIKGETRSCVSCLYELSSDFEIRSSEVALTEICVKERLSYEEVDTMLEAQQGVVCDLYNIAMAFEAGRLSNGGMKIPKRDVEVFVHDRENLETSDFHIQELDESGPARSLVGEMMISANRTLAEFAKERGIPFIYRSQEGGSPIEDDGRELAGPAHDYKLKSTLKRSVMGTRPGSHATLGLPIYTQTTSPIRRYTDLCNQRQVVAILIGAELPYTEKDLEGIIHETSQPLGISRVITRETKRCWLLRYLQRKRDSKTIEATVVRDDMRNYLIELEEVYMPCILKSQRKLKAGDNIVVSIKQIDPRYDILKLEYVSH